MEKDDPILCVCRGIHASDIDAAVAQGAETLEELEEKLGVCEKCGACRRTVQAYLDSVCS